MLGAGGENGPDAFAPAHAGVAASALHDMAIDDDMPNRLFSQVFVGSMPGVVRNVK